MIVARAPLRISFLGGGTDYCEYFEEHGGAVIATAIDKFSYVTLHKLTSFFEHSIRLSYSKLEYVADANQLQHAAVREVLNYMRLTSNIEINCIADLPARTGLGSSGSFIVALLQGVYAYLGKSVTPEQIAMEAIKIERDVMKIYVGCQDQYIAAVGGFNYIEFSSGRTIRHRPLQISQERRARLEGNCLLFYTGLQRSASETVKDQVERTSINLPYLKEMKDLVIEGKKVLESSGPLAEFGGLLDQGWKLKQSLSKKVSNGLINEMYEGGKQAGALGGKLLGAGGGGFVLFYAEPEHHAAVRGALASFKEVQFQFENSGCQVDMHWEKSKRSMTQT
jgi:D-glycero-alpha-D-manno-heptose-7-phosphate kinase